MSALVRAAAAIGLVLVTSTWLDTGGASPVPPGFDFPASEAALLKLRDGEDVRGMRRHAWMVFAGLTASTAAGPAVWETWYSSDEVFRGAVRSAPDRGRTVRIFRSPRQLDPPGAAADRRPTLPSMVLFNEEARTFIIANELNRRETLRRINAGFDAETLPQGRTIAEFPRGAIALKTVWWIVKQRDVTTLPVWDPELNPPNPFGIPVRKWKRCVAVDPSRASIAESETRVIQCAGQAIAARVVPLQSLHHYALTQEQIDQMKGLKVSIENLEDAVAGDFVVLVAFHFATREIPEWVWGTLWWHDRPDAGAFARDRPAEVREVWRNYLMTETYSMETPRTRRGLPRQAFNPWLEGPMADGARSNCMTCHRRAVFSEQPEHHAHLPVTIGTPSPDEERFRKGTKLSFLWSLLLETQ